MRTSRRLIGMALLLSVALAPISALASPPPAQTDARGGPAMAWPAWEPLAKLWEWMASLMPAPRFSSPRSGGHRIEGPPPATQPGAAQSGIRPDDGPGADPYG